MNLEIKYQQALGARDKSAYLPANSDASPEKKKSETSRIITNPSTNPRKPNKEKEAAAAVASGYLKSHQQRIARWRPTSESSGV